MFFSRVTSYCLLMAVLAASTPLQAQDSLLESGPMLGYVHNHVALIWVQTKEPAQVQLEYWGKGEKPRKSKAVQTKAESFYCAKIALDDLLDGVEYEYRLLINGKQVPRPYPLKFKTRKIWLYRTDPPPVRFAVGSCFYVNDLPDDRPGESYGAEFEILDHLLAAKPEFMVWLGDNVYLREPDFIPARMVYRYRHTRAFPALQPLIAAFANYATWDDHDFGPNDSNRSFAFKDESLQLFKEYWPNPSFGMPETKGVFFNFDWADLEFFMLDDRYYRASEDSRDLDKSFLGKAQLDWLKDSLEASHATFKFVVCGNQVLNFNSFHESYSHYKGEFADFMNWLNTSEISGVVFLSGDRHYAEILKIDRPDNYPLFEFTSSPLTSGMSRLQGVELNNPISLPNTRVTDKRNFGLIEVKGARNNRILTIQTIDSTGKLRFTFQIREEELKRPKKHVYE